MATAKRLPPNAGKGRKPGVCNKVTKSLREMITGALDEVGGQAYLVQLAKSEPKTFCTLLAKIVPPAAPEGEGDGKAIHITLVGALTDDDEDGQS